MFVDQNEIDALLAAAEAESAAEPQAPVAVARRPVRRAPLDPKLARILRIRVPAIARLAALRMTVREIRELASGRIIELEQSVDAPIDVLINNHVIARAAVVRVGDNFGLQIVEVLDRSERIESLRG